MKASKFTDAQKAFILKQGADGPPLAEICRKGGGISEATYFIWKKMDLSRNYAAPITRLGRLAFEGQRVFASQS